MNNISFPNHWERPKYSLGQTIKRGQIVGMEYNPPGTRRAHELGKGWSYTVMLDEFEEDVEIIRESAIKLPSTEDLQAEIDSLPQMQLSKFVNALKSYTSQQIRKEFLTEIRRVYWGKPVFWNSAYFVATREWGNCRGSKTIRPKPRLLDLRPRQIGDSSPTPRISSA